MHKNKKNKRFHIKKVQLEPSSIPGATLDDSRSLEDHTVTELKRWLEVRGLKQSGRKDELVKRCQDCISSGQESIIDIAVDKGLWHKKALAASNQSSSSSSHPPILPITGWQTFPSVDMPEYFNKGHVHFYLYEQCKDLAMNYKDNTTVKPLRRGVLYCDSNHITDVRDKQDSSYYYVKCKVKASYKCDYYSCTATLSQESSSIISCTCDCKQSALGRCSHVAGLLQYMLDHVEKNGYSALTCTQKPCYWKIDKGGKKEKYPKQAQIASYKSRSLKKHVAGLQHRIDFDPRATDLRDESQLTITKLFSFIHTESLKYNKSYSPAMWEFLTPLVEYADFVLDKNELEIVQMFIYKYYEDYFAETDEYKYHELCQAKKVPDTDQQSSSNKWHQMRRQIISASVAKKVSCFRTSEAKKSFLAAHLWGINKCQTKAMKYGIDNEEQARKAYQDSHPENSVTTAGLLLDAGCPQLGCSPDGFLKTATGEVQLIEIKCFPTLQKGHPKDFDKLLNKKQLNAFCLEKNNHGMEIKKNHYIYYQIQMQLGITKLNQCTLLFWSPHGLLTFNVEFNATFYHEFKKKLLEFHSEYLVPELHLLRTPRGLAPLQITHFEGRAEQII